jgi:MarR family transcriptional regulator, negative regulator of the multidrug operon emrRAB
MNFAEREKPHEVTSPVDEASETLDRLLRAASHIRLRLGEFLEQFALTEVRYSVLAALRIASRTGLSQSELAERMLQSESNISTLTERMQHEGLVDRLRSHADRRKRVLLLSARGTQLLDRVDIAKRIWAAQLLRAVPAEDRSALGVLMGLLVAIFTGSTGGKPAVSAPDLADAACSRDGRVWTECHGGEGAGMNSPHLALRQMLSALGLTNQLAGDDA